MDDQKDAPLQKTQTDLPLPGTELPEQVKPPRKSFRLLKSFLFGFLFVVIIAIVAGGIFLSKNSNMLKSKQVAKTVINSPTPTPTTNLVIDNNSGIKKYTNLASGFSFEVPSNIKVTYDDQGSYLYRIYPDSGNTKSVILLHNFGTSAMNLQDIESEATAPETETGGPKFQIKKSFINVGGIPALRYEYVPNTNNTIYVDVINNNKTANQIEFISSAQDKENLATILPVFEKILPTFKFTDTSPTPTCRPRPSCLDSIPECKMVETSDMCPPTPKPSSSLSGPGEHCGGNISTAKQCSSGYHCQLNKIADLGGTCVAN